MRINAASVGARVDDRVDDRVDARLGDALATMATFDDESFDLAFIDADKPPYPAYYDRALELVRPGGLVLLDDTLVRGRVVTGASPGDGPHIAPAVEAIVALDERIHADPRVDRLLLPWRDGPTVVRKK